MGQIESDDKSDAYKGVWENEHHTAPHDRMRIGPGAGAVRMYLGTFPTPVGESGGTGRRKMTDEQTNWKQCLSTYSISKAVREAFRRRQILCRLFSRVCGPVSSEYVQWTTLGCKRERLRAMQAEREETRGD